MFNRAIKIDYPKDRGRQILHFAPVGVAMEDWACCLQLAVKLQILLLELR